MIPLDEKLRTLDLILVHTLETILSRCFFFIFVYGGSLRMICTMSGPRNPCNGTAFEKTKGKSFSYWLPCINESSGTSYFQPSCRIIGWSQDVAQAVFSARRCRGGESC